MRIHKVSSEMIWICTSEALANTHELGYIYTCVSIWATQILDQAEGENLPSQQTEGQRGTILADQGKDWHPPPGRPGSDHYLPHHKHHDSQYFVSSNICLSATHAPFHSINL